MHVEVLQLAVEIVFDTFLQVTVEAMLVEDLDVSVVLGGERNLQGSVRDRSAVCVQRRLAGVAEGIAD